LQEPLLTSELNKPHPQWHNTLLGVYSPSWYSISFSVHVIDLSSWLKVCQIFQQNTAQVPTMTADHYHNGNFDRPNTSERLAGTGKKYVNLKVSKSHPAASATLL